MGNCGGAMLQRASVECRLPYVVVEDVVQDAGHAGHVAILSRYVGIANSRKLEDDYELDGKVLGSGVNGPVRSATRRSAECAATRFAVKTLRKSRNDSSLRERLKNEVEISLSLDHPQIVRLEQVFESKDRLDLVMECMEGGELLDRLAKAPEKRFDEKQAAIAVRQMLLAVKYLHARGIVHRDLKPENFLYERADSDHLKLADFGFARRFNAESRMQQQCGTPSYVAPEVLAASYTEKADLWSLGVIAFVMLLGKFPVEGEGNEFLDNLEKGHIVHGPRFQNLSPDAQAFLNSLVVVDPTKRLSAAEALQHKWLQDHHEHKTASISGNILKSMRKFAEAPEAKRACLGVAAWVMPLEDTLMLRELFSAIDCDGKGTITPNALRHAVGQTGQSEDAFHLFTSMDTNGDGQISYSEFLAGGLQGLATFHMDAVRETFNRLDANGDGFITAEELRSVVGDHAAGEITAENFRSVVGDHAVRDADYDGDDAVSLPEFFKFLEGVSKAPTPLRTATPTPPPTSPTAVPTHPPTAPTQPLK